MRGTVRPPQSARDGRAARQRSIRSTITILLVIPLLSLIALWAYAAVSTVGGAIANQNDNTLNQLIGAPIAALAQALETERADTFVWQSAHARYQSRSPAARRGDAASAAAMDAQRPRPTPPSPGSGPPPRRRRACSRPRNKPAAATLLADLSRITQPAGQGRRGHDPGADRLRGLHHHGERNRPVRGRDEQPRRIHRPRTARARRCSGGRGRQRHRRGGLAGGRRARRRRHHVHGRAHVVRADGRRPAAARGAGRLANRLAGEPRPVRAGRTPRPSSRTSRRSRTRSSAGRPGRCSR